MSSNSGEENKIHPFLNKIIALEKWKLINFLFYCVLDIYIDKIFNICPKHFLFLDSKSGKESTVKENKTAMN